MATDPCSGSTPKRSSDLAMPPKLSSAERPLRKREAIGSIPMGGSEGGVMNTRRKEIHVLRCEEPGCGVSFMTVKGDGVDERIGLAHPRRVERQPGGDEVTGTCGRHGGGQ